MRKNFIAKAILGSLAAAAALITTAAPVSAHAGINLYGAKATAGGYGAFFVRIPHGCEKLPTDTIEVAIPSGFSAVRPQQVAGWNAETVQDAAGVVVSVKWSGGSLPDSQFADFGINVKYPTAAGKYPIPVIQYCGTASSAWIEVAAAGQDSHSLVKPAPVLTVEAKADGGHGHGASPAVKTVGDFSAEITSKKGHSGHLLVIADLPSTWRGKTVAVQADGKLIKRIKLDKAGDFELMTASVKKGSKGWMVMEGSKVDLLYKGKVINSVAIAAAEGADYGSTH
jgi:uncharacterized protein YcnI